MSSSTPAAVSPACWVAPSKVIVGQRLECPHLKPKRHTISTRLAKGLPSKVAVQPRQDNLLPIPLSCGQCKVDQVPKELGLINGHSIAASVGFCVLGGQVGQGWHRQAGAAESIVSGQVRSQVAVVLAGLHDCHTAPSGLQGTQ